MIRLEMVTDGRVEACARIYMEAYAAPPWEETYEPREIEQYLRGFCAGGAYRAYVLTKDGACVALALCVLIPGVGCPSLRVEDFCVAPAYQRKGWGSVMMRLLKEQAAKLGADCILLGTQRDFPSHAFYLKNGFTPIDTSVLLYSEVKNDEHRHG